MSTNLTTGRHVAPLTLHTAFAEERAKRPPRTGLGYGTHRACGAIDEDDQGRRVCLLPVDHVTASAHRFTPCAA